MAISEGGIRGVVFTLLVIGVAFHVIYAWSIFDIYFRSPLTHGMTPEDPPTPAPAKRLVLFVADGLRADKFFENRMGRSPFLRRIVEREGSWGVSHTRVPTESRPGHVAIIAGFYEDVSAVTRGWKTNPVEFDSVFNQSRKTWSFGSPDILPMFAEGSTDKSKVETFMYAAETEDFADEDASRLDTWVFDRVDKFFEDAKSDEKLTALLNQDKIVFFLHLLGLDTNGHAHRPFSKEYLENIDLVDRGIEAFVTKLEKYYKGDKKTAYLLTADHGMHNLGNHGDGHKDNTETPVVAWGAGISRPFKTQAGKDSVDGELWGLGDLQRKDVRQADLAPLMSTLIGVPYPMNSVGELPIPYLDNTETYKAKAAFGNARQILRQFLIKEESKRHTELSFVPFPKLENHSERIKEIEGLIATGEIDAAEEKSLEVVRLSIEGLRYYQTYDWLFLRGIISSGYAGWIVYSLIFIVKTYGDVTLPADVLRQGSSTIDAIAFVTFAGFSALLYYKGSPMNYYLYILFLVYLWRAALKDRAYAIAAIARSFKDGTWLSSVGKAVFYVGALEVLVYSYFSREVLTPCLVAGGLIWPFMLPVSFRERNRSIVMLWRFFCLSTSVFTFLTVEKHEDMKLVTLGGLLVLASAVVAMFAMPRYVASLSNARAVESKYPPTVLLIQAAVILVSIIVVNDTSGRLRLKQGLPVLNQAISWMILFSCILIPVLDVVKEGQHYLRRIVVIYLSFAPLFILLSISYEVLFYFSFSNLLFAWLLMERELYSYSKANEPLSTDYKEVTRMRLRSTPKLRSLTTDDLRIATIFLFLVNVAFFGTGNIASVSSFSLESVYRFTTLFNPFLMGALLLTKIWVPFFLLSAVFGVLSRSLELPAFSLFLLVLSTTDVMTLNFFFLVKDDGSWLEIGTTISHFIIASAFIVFQIVLFSVGHLLVGRVLIPEVSAVALKKKK